LPIQRTWHYFDEKERRKWQNPETILADIGLKPGMTFLDIGCGNGFFTLPAARIVGSLGIVFGLDSSPIAISEIQARADKEDLHNIQLRIGNAEETVVCEGCADLIFYGIVLHDFQDARIVLENALRMLKPKGRLADLDWKKIEMPFGPPLSVRFDEATAAGLIESAGFKIESVKDCGEFNYLILSSA
jgi:ubiquinone/menaquinone biosynthesis C-methylase UbiE